MYSSDILFVLTPKFKNKNKNENYKTQAKTIHADAFVRKFIRYASNIMFPISTCFWTTTNLLTERT